MNDKPHIRESMIKAALRAEISPDELTTDEQKLFGATLLDAMSAPSAKERTFYENLRNSSTEGKK
ncbi:MAG: hypothetical protein ABF335_02765 [Alphaproteobacteria bacterium]